MKSFISWIGGKMLLRKEIVSLFPTGKFDFYIEAFGGAAWVLFEKERHSETEIYNDMNGNLVNLFRCVKYHCDELQKELRFVLNSREVFEHFKGMSTDGMTDIQRAARFFMMVKTSYGAKAENGTFGCVKKDISVMVTYLKAIEYRLSNVVIENRDFEFLIESYGNKKSLFYLDPPYYGTEKYYAAFFPTADHERLFKCLQGLKCDFILSYNDCEYIRDLYRDYSVTEAIRANSLSNKQNSSVFKELIIRNY